jgi:hypothetical protein
MKVFGPINKEESSSLSGEAALEMCAGPFTTLREYQVDLERWLRRSDGSGHLIAVERSYWFHYTVN